MYQELLSRENWAKVGRVVIAPNEEAKNVFVFFGKNVCRSRHVFSEDQTLPVEQSECAAAA